AFVLVRDWFGDPGAVDRDAALAELARRYLAGHGPAGDRDLAKWAGLPLRDVRRGLAAIASELEQGSDGLVDLAGRPGGDVLPAPSAPPWERARGPSSRHKRHLCNGPRSPRVTRSREPQENPGRRRLHPAGLSPVAPVGIATKGRTTMFGRKLGLAIGSAAVG